MATSWLTTPWNTPRPLEPCQTLAPLRIKGSQLDTVVLTRKEGCTVTDGTLEDECRVISIVVTYNPDLALFRTALDHLLRQVTCVLIVDNGSTNNLDLKSLLAPIAAPIEVIDLERNYGIAYALNCGIGRAMLQHPTWILTTDQDTIIHDGAIADVLHAHAQLDSLLKYSCALVSLRDASERRANGRVDWLTSYCERINTVNDHGEFLEKRMVITSGNLIRPSVFKYVSFNSELFIDQVDFDFCASLRNKGFRILEYKPGRMDHRVGGEVRILGKLRSYEEGQRLYYIIRNGSYLASRRRLSIRFYLAQTVIWCVAYVFANGWLSVFNCGAITVRAVIDGVLARLGQREIAAYSLRRWWAKSGCGR